VAAAETPGHLAIQRDELGTGRQATASFTTRFEVGAGPLTDRERRSRLRLIDAERQDEASRFSNELSLVADCSLAEMERRVPFRYELGEGPAHPPGAELSNRRASVLPTPHGVILQACFEYAYVRSIIRPFDDVHS
jgi:hypothetical protein